MQIRSAGNGDARLLAELVSESNRDVAVRFGLNADNCPKHPSFCAESWITKDLERGARYFVADRHGEAVGCVAFEYPGENPAYLNRLSVLPSCRRQGVGEMLVRHVLDLARSSGINTVSIGIIAAHAELKRWYMAMGFVEGETKSFPHLPFAVSYLTYAVQDLGR